MTAAPSPARYAQGDAVLALGAPATVSVVYPPDAHGRRHYEVEWPVGVGSYRDGLVPGRSVGVVGEADLAPMVVS